MDRCLLRADVEERNAATHRHCRRVAALALEVARASGLPSSLDPVLEQAALFHHSLDLARKPKPLDRLALDVLGAEGFDGISELHMLKGIVAMCNLVDEQIEALEFEPKEIDEILEEISEFAAFEGFDPCLVDHLRRFHCADLLCRIESGDGLPVEARSAQRVFRALWQERDYEVEELEGVAHRDPVLAGTLVGVANSALYSPSRKLSSVEQAISYIGTVAARRVLMAAVLRPLFASSGLRRLWSHSMNSAHYCSGLAEHTSFLGAGEGLILGLLHDLGALAAEFLDRKRGNARARLEEGGCPSTYTEKLFFGADHGEIGSRILAGWGFPEHLVEAVRYHHQPERSEAPLAAFLYLAEFWSGVDEDLPSFYRVEHCLARTGLSLESLTQVPPADNAFKALRSVA